MPRERKGSIIERNGSLFARVTFVDSTGKRKDKIRRAENRTEARDLIKQMLREVDEQGEQTLDHTRMTFADLADYYEKHYLTEAEYHHNKKVSGLRSLASPCSQLKILRECFGKKHLRSITHGDIKKFRTARLKTPKRGGGVRSITSVNRELALLRRMFNVAIQEGWIIKNPFSAGKGLIDIAAEHKRERVISFAEETKLLDACTGRRAHLRPLIIAALETGMRRGELLKLRWHDIDFDNQIITVKAFNTKTERERQVRMTAHLCHELETLHQSASSSNSFVFGGIKDVKRSFDSARCAAHLSDVRFHDLRHTHATRLVAAHIPLAEVGRALGHTRPETTYRYTNATLESAHRIANALDSMRAAESDALTTTSEALN